MTTADGEPSKERPKAWPVPVAVAFGGLAIAAAIAWRSAPTEASPHLVTGGTGTMLVALHDVARLETTEVHVERVIDLKDTQSRFFGLVEGSDAILLVASGDCVLGVDLAKLAAEDIAYDLKTRHASFHLPPPEVLSSRLDEEHTYVYSRSTDLMAKRSEHLETEARRRAVESLQKIALEPEHLARAKAQAEKELRALASGFGATDVVIAWR